MPSATFIFGPLILEGYFAADGDSDASPNYYGFVRADGAWYILKETLSAGADTYKYARGSDKYSDNWTNHAGLTYDYYQNVFGA